MPHQYPFPLRLVPQTQLVSFVDAVSGTIGHRSEQTANTKYKKTDKNRENNGPTQPDPSRELRTTTNATPPYSVRERLTDDDNRCRRI